MSAIVLEGLQKTYGAIRALDGLDLTVETGTVFGFLGPNGAGKTTTIRILTGPARPPARRASAAGGAGRAWGVFAGGAPRRRGLGRARVNRPEVLFLEEPVSALDPVGRKEV